MNEFKRYHRLRIAEGFPEVDRYDFPRLGQPTGPHKASPHAHFTVERNGWIYHLVVADGLWQIRRGRPGKSLSWWWRWMPDAMTRLLLDRLFVGIVRTSAYFSRSPIRKELHSQFVIVCADVIDTVLQDASTTARLALFTGTLIIVAGVSYAW